MVDLNKTSTVETLFTQQVKAVEGLLSFQIQSPSIDQRTLFGFVAVRVQQHFWSTRVIKQIHLDSVAL